MTLISLATETFNVITAGWIVFGGFGLSKALLNPPPNPTLKLRINGLLNYTQRYGITGATSIGAFSLFYNITRLLTSYSKTVDKNELYKNVLGASAATYITAPFWQINGLPRIAASGVVGLMCGSLFMVREKYWDRKGGRPLNV